MLRQLRYILPAFLTDPSSSCKTTSIYLWFLLSLRYSLKTMLPDANCKYLAGYWRSGKSL